MALEEGPIFSWGAPRSTRTRNQVEALSTIATLAAQKTRLAKVTRQEKPDSGERNSGLRGEALNYSVENTLDALFAGNNNSERK
jgi:hypothetical protein